MRSLLFTEQRMFHVDGTVDEVLEQLAHPVRGFWAELVELDRRLMVDMRKVVAVKEYPT